MRKQQENIHYRFCHKSIAFTFIVPGEGEFLTNIERRINKELLRDQIEGFEAVAPPPVAKVEEEKVGPAKRKLNPMHRKVRRRR